MFSNIYSHLECATRPGPIRSTIRLTWQLREPTAMIAVSGGGLDVTGKC